MKMSGPRPAIVVEDIELNRREKGFISFGAMTLLVGGCALAGLLAYSWKSGQDLPFWPAVAVILVNLVATAKLVLDTMQARKRQRESASGDPKVHPRSR